MTAADLITHMERLTPEERRRLIALAAGFQAHLDGDGGATMADALRRTADRLAGQPRRTAA